jgi:negative regulator of flagellin synthesis FlgM
MSIIGSSPGIASGPSPEIGAVRAVGSLDRNMPSRSPLPDGTSPVPGAPVVTSTVLEVGGVPVDQARVATIRKAIATGSYPLNPTRIGDAMIAAGMVLRMSK